MSNGGSGRTSRRRRAAHQLEEDSSEKPLIEFCTAPPLSPPLQRERDPLGPFSQRSSEEVKLSAVPPPYSTAPLACVPAPVSYGPPSSPSSTFSYPRGVAPGPQYNSFTPPYPAAPPSQQAPSLYPQAGSPNGRPIGFDPTVMYGSYALPPRPPSSMPPMSADALSSHFGSVKLSPTETPRYPMMVPTMTPPPVNGTPPIADTSMATQGRVVVPCPPPHSRNSADDHKSVRQIAAQLSASMQALSLATTGRESPVYPTGNKDGALLPMAMGQAFAWKKWEEKENTYQQDEELARRLQAEQDAEDERLARGKTSRTSSIGPGRKSARSREAASDKKLALALQQAEIMEAAKQNKASSPPRYSSRADATLAASLQAEEDAWNSRDQRRGPRRQF